MAAKSTKTKKQPEQEDADEPVWTFREYKLKSGEYVTAMAWRLHVE